MKVTLIHTPYYHQDHMENVWFTSNNFAVNPPMGPLYVSSILKEEGHEVQVVDVKAEKLSREEAFEKIEDFDPDLIGGLLIPYTADIALDWYRDISDRFDAPIVVGNHAVKHYPEAVMSNEFIDYGVVGSALNSVPKLVEYLEGEDVDLSEIENLAYREDGEVKINKPDENTEDLDKLPWPDRESIDNSLYHHMASKKSPYTLVITSYGCMYSCKFCDMADWGYSERSPEDVVDEIEYCVEELGIREIDIFDRDFLLNRERSEEIIDIMIERGIDVDWTCRARVDEVDQELLDKMAEAGCRLIMYGIESGSQEILDTEHKGITLEQSRKAIEATKKAGIESIGFFILGHEGETKEQMRETIEFAKELPLDYAQFFKLSGKPGSSLYDQITEELGYDYFDKLIRQEISQHRLPRPWTDLSNEELEEMVLEAYHEYYLRPGYILLRLKKLGSLSELARLTRVGSKILYTRIKSIFS